ncbi:unnamed protein product [Peniophora sp. CBMAI 1063]|nr:unnamed protein product [Peniophora sp. CBMAI 1063]
MPSHSRVSHRMPVLQGVKRARGRPPNAGALQRRMMLEDIDEYRSLKAGRAAQGEISSAVDREARKIIVYFGWEDPLRAVTVKEASDTIESSPVTDEEQKRRDALFKKVRREVLKVWRENLAANVEVIGRPSANILELIKLYGRKPRRKQSYKVWATAQPRPDLEAEVDTRHAAKVQATGPDIPPPPRIATWNAVASEWYSNASKKEKKRARKDAKRLHRQAMDEWEASASHEPQSPEEAIEFMRASQSFLSDLMHFFANRASGVAIMFLSGPDGASLISEGVCNVPERPKLLYTEVNPVGCTDFKYSMAKQAQILNEAKWAEASIAKDHHVVVDESDACQITGERKAYGGGGRENEEEENTDGERSENEADDGAGDIGDVEFLLPLPVTNNGHAKLSLDFTSRSPSALGTAVVDPHSESRIVDIDGIGSVLASAQKTLRSDSFAFAVSANYIPSDRDTAEYSRAFRAAIARILPRKVWLEESNTVNFLKAVPVKLTGRVDVSIACDLSLAYLDFEACQLDEAPLTMRVVGEPRGTDNIEQPRYMAGLCLRDFASRWNSRVASGDNRTPAKLDADINITLPQQWALQQPSERRDQQGRIHLPAATTMEWKNALAPGLDGARLLVVTTLLWAWNIREDGERTHWSDLAIDIVSVLRVLVQQAALRRAEEPRASHVEDGAREGRKKSTRKWKKSAKLRDSA